MGGIAGGWGEWDLVRRMSGSFDTHASIPFRLKLGARGDGLAQWLERWTRDPKVEGSNPIRSARKTLSFSESKMLC